MAKRTGWRRHKLDLKKAGELLRDYAAACKGNPLAAFLYRDASGRNRRITASYADGWSLQINFALGGQVSSYQLTFSWHGTTKA